MGVETMSYYLKVKDAYTPQDISEIRKDIKKLSIEETCKKHKISFKELVKQTSKKSPRATRKPNPHKHIYARGKNYTIQKNINGKFNYFGMYYSLEDACKVRDMLIKYDWKKSCLKKICETLGVGRFGDDK